MTVITSLMDTTPYLPPKVVDVPRDVIRTFQHSKKVGNYLLGKTIGEGSFAKVKEALHIPTGEKVAIKVIDKRKAKEDSYVRKNLRREGKLLQQICHPNIVQLFEVMETENSYYLVTELCKGGDLMDYICKRKKLEEREVKRFIRQLLSALDYIHRLGILHRDLKVENLLLDENKNIKLIDFGLGNSIKITESKDSVRFQELLITQCGSPAYAAPELLGRKKYGPQVDVWSVGINMYAMLTGNLPFTVDPFNIKTLYNKMITGQMNPLPENISRECRDLLKKFLNAEPDKRITVTDAMKHPWIAESRCRPIDRCPCPNRLRSEDLVENITKYMSDIHGFRIGEVIRFVTGNVPSPALAMYLILHRKLVTYMADMRVKGKIPALEAQLLEKMRQQHVFNTDVKYDCHRSQNSTDKNRPPINRTTILHRRTGSVRSYKIESDIINSNVNDNKNSSDSNRGNKNSVHGDVSKSNADNPVFTKVSRIAVTPRSTIHTGNQIDKRTEMARKNTSQENQSASQSRKSLTKLSGRTRPQVQSSSIMNKPKSGREESLEPELIKESSPLSKPRFQKVTYPDSHVKHVGQRNGFVKRTEVKMINNKRLIDLAYTPCKRLLKRNSVSETLCKTKTETESTEKADGQTRPSFTQRPIETFGEMTSQERISPLSCLSKLASSRGTSRSERSSSIRDLHLVLPCISPTPIDRTQ